MLVDVEALQRDNAAQRAQIAELLLTNTSLLSTNTKLVSEIAKLNDRVAELLAIAQRKHRKTATPSEKKPESAPVVEAASALVVEPAAQQAFETRPKPPVLPEKTKGPKERARRTGHGASGRSANRRGSVSVSSNTPGRFDSVEPT